MQKKAQHALGLDAFKAEVMDINTTIFNLNIIILRFGKVESVFTAWQRPFRMLFEHKTLSSRSFLQDSKHNGFEHALYS